MDSCTDIDDTMNAFNCNSEPVKHLIEGLNLKAEDFRERQFDLHGITVTLDRVEAEYPVITADGKPRTDFYLVLYCRKGDQEHDVLVRFPYDKKKQALELYEALDYCDLTEPPACGIVTRTKTATIIGDASKPSKRTSAAIRFRCSTPSVIAPKAFRICSSAEKRLITNWLHSRFATLRRVLTSWSTRHFRSCTNTAENNARPQASTSSPRPFVPGASVRTYGEATSFATKKTAPIAVRFTSR